MRIDLPQCNLKTCRYSSDGNCVEKNRFDGCEHAYTLEENEKLKAEIEQLKEIRNKYGLLLEMYDKKQKEIEQLKSELEQSVKLPCNVGDVIYTTNWVKTKVFENIVTGFEIYLNEVFILTYVPRKISIKNLGSHLFLTREEAEKALKAGGV